MTDKIESSAIPQARNLRHVRAVVQALSDNRTGKAELAKILRCDERHIDYCVAAARTLGLIDGTLSTATVTDAGRSLLDTPADSTPEADCFSAAIRGSNILRLIAPTLLEAQSPAKSELITRICAMSDLKETTASSRADTLIAWRSWIKNGQQDMFAALSGARPEPAGQGKSAADDVTPPADVPFRSEIRPSAVKQLLDKVKQGNYGSYLRSLTVRKLRAIEGERVSFNFPVTALIGPNGEGKTTLLGAAACAYQSIKPHQYFAKSGKLDESMKDWGVDYEIIDRKANPKGLVRRSANFVSSKWSRKALPRSVLAFGVHRTVPANERAELRRCASGTFEVKQANVQPLTTKVAVAVERILGRPVKDFNHIRVDAKGRISLLSGTTPAGVNYSEFHFGAGESSVIRMVMKIEESADNSLILIEEIENGLHPVATIRMVEYLIEVAERKKAQAIFTTHSNDALKPLPSEAIWATVGGRVFQGKLDIHALRALTGQVDAQVIVFVEDAFATEWVTAMLRARAPELVEFVEVYPMQGDGAAVQVHHHHNISPASRGKSFCFIDGDSRQKDDPDKLIFRLPGESPEAHVYDTLIDRLEECCGELAVALHQRFENQAAVMEVVRSVRLTNRDPHVIFNQVGRRLGFISETVVKSAFLSTWTKYYELECAQTIRPLVSYLQRYFGARPRPRVDS